MNELFRKRVKRVPECATNWNEVQNPGRIVHALFWAMKYVNNAWNLAGDEALELGCLQLAGKKNSDLYQTEIRDNAYAFK